MNIEKWKEKSEKSLSEVEKEAKILLDRIEKAKKCLENVNDRQDANRFFEENDIEHGFKHICLFQVIKMKDEMRKNEVKRVITCKMEDIASLVANSGYTVTIRPTKDGAKITSHKEKVMK